MPEGSAQPGGRPGESLTPGTAEANPSPLSESMSDTSSDTKNTRTRSRTGSCSQFCHDFARLSHARYPKDAQPVGPANSNATKRGQSVTDVKGRGCHANGLQSLVASPGSKHPGARRIVMARYIVAFYFRGSVTPPIRSPSSLSPT